MTRGAPSEIESLYRQHGDRLWRAIRSYAGTSDIADDAVAEAFAQALRRGAAIRSPLRWIWTAAFKIAAAELKERSRLSTLKDSDSTYEMTEPSISLLAALQQLSPKQRGSLILYHYAGYSVREVANILASTGPAVRVHLTRARRRLRDLLEEDTYA